MTYDPFVSLSIAAGVTKHVELGTAILQLPLYHPTDVALKSFSLMQESNGRFLLGIGAGSTESDHLVLHSDFSSRFHNFSQKLDVLRSIFKTGQFEETDLTPWLSVEGGPPILHGTWGQGVEVAATEYQGWIASGMHRGPSQLEKAISRYRKAGGSRAIVSTIILGKEMNHAAVQNLLSQYRNMGFDDAVVMFTPGSLPPSEVRQMI